MAQTKCHGDLQGPHWEPPETASSGGLGFEGGGWAGRSVCTQRKEGLSRQRKQHELNHEDARRTRPFWGPARYLVGKRTDKGHITGLFLSPVS